MHIWVGSFNVDSYSGNYSDLPLSGWMTAGADMYILGMQEYDTSPKALLWNQDEQQNRQRSCLLRHLENYFANMDTEKDYSLLLSHQYASMYLIIYVSTVVADATLHVDVDDVGLGLLNVMGNKGAIGARITFTTSPSNAREKKTKMEGKSVKDATTLTSLCLISCHLAPHMKSGSLRKRNTQCYAIFDELSFLSSPDSSSTVSLYNNDLDHTIFFGDLNYRVPLDRSRLFECIKRNDFATILQHDELKEQLRAVCQPSSSSSRSSSSVRDYSLAMPLKGFVEVSTGSIVF